MPLFGWNLNAFLRQYTAASSTPSSNWKKAHDFQRTVKRHKHNVCEQYMDRFFLPWIRKQLVFTRVTLTTSTTTTTKPWGYKVTPHWLARPETKTSSSWRAHIHRPVFKFYCIHLDYGTISTGRIFFRPCGGFIHRGLDTHTQAHRQTDRHTNIHNRTVKEIIMLAALKGNDLFRLFAMLNIDTRL